jgi:hypothetical protein
MEKKVIVTFEEYQNNTHREESFFLTQGTPKFFSIIKKKINLACYLGTA